MMNHRKSSKTKAQSEYEELTDTLSNMGLNVSEKQVKEAVHKLYPNGIEQEDMGVIIRDLFRYFKNQV